MKRTSREIWSERVHRWKASGLTAKKFAARRGLSACTLYYWSWRQSAEARDSETGRLSSAPTFVEIVGAADVVGHGSQAVGVRPVAEPFEILLGDRIRIRVPVNFDEAALCRLVAILERR
jgi:hypothetical protein